MESKEIIEHKDALGNIITETSKLAVAHHNQLAICSIVKITNKMLRVSPINSRNYSRHEGYLVYPSQTVVVDGPDVTVYILRSPSK